jgi:prolyl-tRNA synthetase
MPDFITDPNKDFPQWYQDVVHEAGLAEHSPVKGCMIIKPYGYAIWERIQRYLDAGIKKLGVQNAYFPLFIPEKFLTREAQHVEGFAPEVAWVTHGGGKELEEKLAVRPTSETIMYDTFSRWVQSYRDLPLKINQWANVVRWEMRPRLFLRTLEFLWQEGHTAHANREEAAKMVDDALSLYQSLVEEVLAIAVLPGQKSDSEKFAGALYTTTIEALMRDGKALQMGTSHHLGDNFAKAFGIQYLDATGNKQFAWQTSWGISTRLIGGLVMAHGDAKGLVLPPRIAPIQIIIIPIAKNDEEKARVQEALAQSVLPPLERILMWDEQVRMQVDNREGITVGRKYNEWEVKGVPLRIEIGPRDVQKNEVTLVRRDTGAKEPIPLAAVAEKVQKALQDSQTDMQAQHRAYTASHTVAVHSLEEFTHAIGKGGFVRAPWCGSAACEGKVKEMTKATVRVIMDEGGMHGACMVCGARAASAPYFAIAY